MDKIKVGIIGCGNISDIYLENLIKKFDNIDLVAVADLIFEKAALAAEKYDNLIALSVDEILSNKEIKIIVNLTIPNAHFDVNMAALKAGKNVYVEKPLAITREDGAKTLALAKEKNLLVGGAPDTFLGAGIQTCIKLIQDGWIGTPVATTAFMTCHGHEGWHPDPEFYYKFGGGPMFDMGPYYLTALIAMLGPIKRVTGSAKISFDTRTITSEKKYGTKIDVEVPTHIAGIMDFNNGVIGTIITSFDVWHANLPKIEIYGSTGSISVPDPNTFGGPVLVKSHGSNEWSEIPLIYNFENNSRGIGVADMAHAIQTGKQHRASGELTFHVLDLMHGFHDASKNGAHYLVQSTCEMPRPLKLSSADVF